MASRTCTSNRLSVEGCLLFMSRHVDLIYISLNVNANNYQKPGVAVTRCQYVTIKSQLCRQERQPQHEPHNQCVQLNVLSVA